jgi:arylsulfatase A-like enzyme/Flp pilus assembly protein TadD
LGCYGYREAETPNLDRLARDGVRFEQAESAVPLTLPSHATILSALLPMHHGLRNNGSGRFPEDRPTLAVSLSAAGYRTGAFIGSFVLDRRFGLSRGFDVYDDSIERDPDGSEGLEAERPGSAVVDRALAWLEGSSDANRTPFFAWIHLFDAHAPYTPPEPFRSRHAESPYDGEIAFVDAQIGRLLDFLDRHSMANSTIVAVAGDHGESLGEHGELSHGLLLYEATLRVPLLLRAPGLVGAGWTAASPMGLVDLAPTLVGLLQSGSPRAGSSAVPAPAALSGDGRDLSASLRRRSDLPPTEVYSETEYPRIFGWSGLVALRRGRMKYIAAPRSELYDLRSDPGERSNRLAASQRRPDLEARLETLRRNAMVASPIPGTASDTLAKLASLGYIGGKPAEASSPGDARRLKDPKDMVSFFRKFEEANWAVQAGKADAAAKILEPLVSGDPENAVFRGLLAKAYRRQGNLGRSVELYRQAAADAPDDPEPRYNLAVTLQEAGRHTEALAAVTEAIRLDPSRPEAHNALGISLSQSGELKGALAEFDRAAALDTRDARAQNNRGNVLRQLGRLEEAEQSYRRAIEISPRFAEPWNGLGTLEVARDRPAAALPYFEQALTLAPQYHEVRLNLGIAQETLGNSSAALDAYRDFVRAADGDPGFAAQRNVARQLIARLSNSRSSSSNSERR